MFIIYSSKGITILWMMLILLRLEPIHAGRRYRSLLLSSSIASTVPATQSSKHYQNTIISTGIQSSNRNYHQQHHHSKVQAFGLRLGTSTITNNNYQYQSISNVRSITTATTLKSHQCFITQQQSVHRSISSSSLLLSSSNDDGFKSDSDNKEDPFFANMDFRTLGVQSPILLKRLTEYSTTYGTTNNKFDRPTWIQAQSFNIIRDGVDDVLVGAETGTGKTLAYLLPIFDDIIQIKKSVPSVRKLPYDYGRVLILLPNKELIQQVVTMASILASSGNIQQSLVFPPQSSTGSTNVDNDHDIVDPTDIVRIGIIPGGLKEIAIDYVPFRNYFNTKNNIQDLPLDVLVSTPAAIGPLALSMKNLQFFADIKTIVLDEADMLLDGGYIRSIQDVFLGFKRADKIIRNYIPSTTSTSNSYNQQYEQHNIKEYYSYDNDNDYPGEQLSKMTLSKEKTQYIFVAATLPDYGLRSVDAFITRKFPSIQRIVDTSMHNAYHYGLSEPTEWIDIPTKQQRTKLLVDRITTTTTTDTSTTTTSTSLQNEKIMIFVNSLDDVDNVCTALSRATVDTPVQINPIPYHAKMSLDARTKSLNDFRMYNPTVDNGSTSTSTSTSKPKRSISVLVCTDLASRGLDIPDVTCVVQLQFATNAVAHLHRMGRCGRAGRRIGKGIIFYDSSTDNELALVETIQLAETSTSTSNNNRRMVLQGSNIYDDDDDDEIAVSTGQQQLDDRYDGGENDSAGKVDNAFSRKRGFTKKRKKLRRKTENVAEFQQD